MLDRAKDAAAAADSVTLRRQAAGMAMRAAAAMALLGILALLLRDRIAALDVEEIRFAVSRIAPLQWLTAAGATLISFWAVGRYDRVIHAMMGTGVPPGAAGRAGVIAIAIGQAVGMGVLTGALVRWRLLPGIGLWKATRLALAVAVSFLCGLAVVAAALVAVTGFPAMPGLRPAAAVVLAIALALPVLAALPLRRLKLPPFPAMAAILVLTAVDCTGAALALGALLPPGHVPSLPVLLTAVTIAMGAGIVSSTPGGLGPFELTLIALLPAIPAEPLLATVLAFRLVYYLIPALIAAAVAGIEAIRASPAPPLLDLQGAAPPETARDLGLRLHSSTRAEAGLVRETGLALFRDGVPVATLARAGSSLVLLGDPWQPSQGAPALTAQAARRRCLVPLLYKCSRDLAREARREGWAVVEVAAEASVDPRAFSLDTPTFRQLRRRLRKAEAAGIRAAPVRGGLPLDRLAQINAAWSAAHGGERGFSMGRFPAASLSRGRAFLAWQDDEIVAFASFHACRAEWTLDLIRYEERVPDGTVQALICAAIEAAAAEGVPSLSLAAVPRLARHLPPALARRYDEAAGTAGLTRFKTAFAPHWEPLYAAAPNRAALAVGLVAVAAAVRGA